MAPIGEIMKKLIVILAITICFLVAIWADKSEYTLHVTVKGLRNDNGNVLLALYNGKAGFPENAEKAVDKVSVSIRDGKAQADFQLSRSGSYAVCVLHDENNNGVMDKGLFGVPLEGYGFSNDAMGVMSAPSFEDAAVRVSGSEHHIVINIKY
jgi:uncharacterized protein (DUF2141 family)